LQKVSQNALLKGGIALILFAVLIALGLISTAGAQTSTTQTVQLPASADTYLNQSSPSSNYGSATSLSADGDDPGGTGNDKRVLIKFDLSQIPSGATIQSARLKFNVVNASANTYNTHYLKRNWTENGASWNTYNGTSGWGSAGASSSTYDRGGTDLAPFRAGSTGAVSVSMNSSGVAKVQEWVNGTTPNYGLMIWNSSNTDGIGLSSREASSKPTLEVTYSTGTSTGTDMATWTSLERYHYKTQIEPMEKWLAGSRPYIGEINTPNSLSGPHCCDVPQWQALLEKMMVQLDEDYASISFWSVDERQQYGGYNLNAYTSGSDGQTSRAIDTPQVQAQVLEKHLGTSGYKRGFNEAAGTQLCGSCYAGNPGTHGPSGVYHYAGAHVSPTTGQDTFQYMKSRGYDHVRLGFRWERLQPTLGGAFNTTELQRIKTAVADANAAGLGVVIEPHNYAYYKISSTTYAQMGDGRLTKEHFYDLWRRLSTEFKGNTGVIAYDLMNEPGVQGTIPAGSYGSAQKAWEAYAQGALNTIRNNADNKLIYVPTWRNSANAPAYHPGGKWISDSANNFQYAFHYYFWIDGWKNGGNYSVDYPTENSTARSMGY
jgi:hypothetical protein